MNYIDTLIAVAPDCPVTKGVVPSTRGGKKPIALIQYELISAAPYAYTQEEVLWRTHIRHKDIPSGEADAAAREAFFAKPKACLRAAALAKKYGWGFHFNHDGKVALVPMESVEYRRFVQPSPDGPKVLAALRNKRE